MSRRPPRLPAFVRLDPFVGWSTIDDLSQDIRIDPATGTLALAYPGSQSRDELLEPGGSFGGLTLPTGVAIDGEGTVLVADPEGGRILRNPHPALFPPPRPEEPPCPPGCDCDSFEAGNPGNTVDGFAPLWTHEIEGEDDDVETSSCNLEPVASAPPGPYELLRPIGLTFSREGDLLVVDQGDAGHRARLLVYTWPDLAVRHEIELAGRPHDIAIDPDGQVLVADMAAGRVLRFDRFWRLQTWAGGEGVLNLPKHLMVGGNGTILVIDTDSETGSDRLSSIDALGRAHPVASADLPSIWRQTDWPPPIQESGQTLYAPGDPCLELGRELLAVKVDRRGRLPQGPQLIYRPRRGGRFREGKAMIGPIDSDKLNFAWHRILLDVELGSADALEIRTYTDATALEPERVEGLPEQAWSRRTVLNSQSVPELLIQSPPGRYLWVEIGLVGDGTSSPQLRALDILGPRKSSLQFLPAPFHEDGVGRDFLDRFLSYFDTIFDEISAKIENFSAQLTPDGAREGAYLAWLLSWFDFEVLSAWDDATRRAFLDNAMRLHRARGTVAGIRALVRLHCGLAEPMPVLIEGFRLKSVADRFAEGGAQLSGDRLRIGGFPLEIPSDDADLAHSFVVVVPSSVIKDGEARDTLARLVDSYRPAHTQWRLIVVQPGLRIGCQSTIGVDTLVGSYPSAPLGEMRLGQSSTTAPPPSRVPRVGDARLNSTRY